MEITHLGHATVLIEIGDVRVLIDPGSFSDQWHGLTGLDAVLITHQHPDHVDPQQVPDFIALRGDSSDKIPGAKGIGPGRAATILREYETLDGAIEAGVFQEQAEALRTYLRIARLQFEAPVPKLPDAQPRWEKAADLAEGWGLKALSKRMRERA